MKANILMEFSRISFEAVSRSESVCFVNIFSLLEFGFLHLRDVTHQTKSFLTESTETIPMKGNDSAQLSV